MNKRLLEFRNAKSLKHAENFCSIILDETGIDIKEKNREDNVVFYRRLYYKFMVEVTKDYKESLSRIAAHINQTHATVLHSIKQLDNELAVNPSIMDQYNYFRSIALGTSQIQSKYESPKSKKIQKELNILEDLRATIKSQKDKIYNLRLIVKQKESELKYKTKQFNGLSKESRELRSELKDIYTLYKKASNIHV